MKRAVVLGSIFVGICIALYAGAADELVFFVISGRIPFTNIVISPFGMIAFWLLVIPVSTLLFPAFRHHFWTTIESIGQMSQRRINRSLRQAIRIDTLELLLATVLLHIALNLPESSAPLPALELRRRFIALPS